jgi:hypothetical protein
MAADPHMQRLFFTTRNQSKRLAAIPGSAARTLRSLCALTACSSQAGPLRAPVALAAIVSRRAGARARAPGLEFLQRERLIHVAWGP